MSKKGIAHSTDYGSYHIGQAEKLLQGKLGEKIHGSVQLILTSPPFPLNKKKSYGNLSGEEYKEWFIGLAPIFEDLIADNGSIVIELGNAWEPGRPIQSLLHLESLMGFVQNLKTDLRLCQQFVCYNPARLPSPAQWVTVERIRTIDSFTNIWWIAKTDYPKADNRKVLRPYSKSMKSLLKRRSYNIGKRPSEHDISDDGFLKDHGGSIQPNLFELEAMEGTKEIRLPNAMRIANTSSSDFFLKECREQGIKPHPARMPPQLAAFFIEFLTDPEDLILDPFAGSNTTGYVAQLFDRRWISIDLEPEYAEQSKIRFSDPLLQKS